MTVTDIDSRGDLYIPEVPMTKMLIDIDEEALADAAEYFGTKTKKDTVNAALNAAAQFRRRMEAFNRLTVMAQRGDFDELLDKQNYRPKP
jgi:Arc/MetJ family transcription regulator